MQRILPLLTQGKKYIIAAIVIYLIGSHLAHSFIARLTNSRSYLSWGSRKTLIGALWDTSRNAITLDVHLEDPELGHTGEIVGQDGLVLDSEGNFTAAVAIGLGITSKGVKDTTEGMIDSQFQFFHTFLPTFCTTASPGYRYAFYLAYDHTDGNFKQESFLRSFKKAFYACISKNCPQNMHVSIHMVQCEHAGKPTWAQNDAMLEAYLDNVDYYYRINDDTKMETAGWLEAFIDTLKKYDPPNLGVVGPTHTGGNTGILTYDFVHRTHVDVLGYYYPRLFTDWWGDDWVTNVYVPGRSTKLSNVHLAHTLGLGQRYGVNFHVGHIWKTQLAIDRDTIKRYLQSLEQPQKSDGSRVISMSLFGRDPKYTWGAIRNAQLAPIYFPGWKLRFYIEDPQSAQNVSRSLAVPPRIVRKLRQLGAVIAYVSSALSSTLPPHSWRYLVVDDEKVEYFLIRDADSRLSDRDASAVKEWMNTVQRSSGERAALHCLRDHPKHVGRGIIDGLWGGHGPAFRNVFTATRNVESVAEALKRYYSTETTGSANIIRQSDNMTATTTAKPAADFLNEIIWPALDVAMTLCHDSVSCPRASRDRTITTPRLKKRQWEYLGQEFDSHHELTSDDGQLVEQFTNNTDSFCEAQTTGAVTTALTKQL